MTNDLLNLTGNLTLDGTLNVAETSAGSFLSAGAGQKWRLITYTGTLTDNVLALGTMPALQSGLSFAIESVTNQVNLLVVGAAVPEPSAFLFGVVISAGVGIAFVSRRRRRPALAPVHV
jgi:hypothetical protein